MECFLEYAATDKGLHFTDALAQNAIEVEAIDIPLAQFSGSHPVIKGISLMAKQALDFDVFIFNKAGCSDAALRPGAYLDYVRFNATGAAQIGAAGFYYYAGVTGLYLPYRDKSNTYKLHVGLVNRSATSKLAGADGEVVIMVALA
ncbi:MAG: hypothetical protein A3J24_06355 [Deltaproteobacteria bacterium RIFCSPLOWO2_02_FULL_53_8]|nr:MAG: hypothetical protein A3J24_06355 [Deltaproteobacteria bacterium RIFCSPLOWO2_02_FULL_53_8]